MLLKVSSSGFSIQARSTLAYGESCVAETELRLLTVSNALTSVAWSKIQPAEVPVVDTNNCIPLSTVENEEPKCRVHSTESALRNITAHSIEELAPSSNW